MSSTDSNPTDSQLAHKQHVPPLSPSLASHNPLRWLAVFGPGAIIASLTIGTGELIFSTRGGVLFGYRVLFLFVIISVLKWGLVFAAARHMTLSGVHPYQRLMELPGPRGWFPLMLLMLATITMPIWVSFLSGVLGNFTSWVTGTQQHFHGAVDYLWGGAILFGVLVLSATGGYGVLERVHMGIVAALVGCAAITLVIYRPDWLEMFYGAFVPQRFEYPSWIQEWASAANPDKQDVYSRIAATPVWVETTRYVGVIGGAGFDYMAYTTWLRDKSWGRSSAGPATDQQLEKIAADPSHPVRKWIRAPLTDCTLSFLIVVAFSAVFVVSGVVVLGPHREIPNEDNFLSLQAKFVTSLNRWLLPIYVAGAFLTMLGTVYGTIEIAKAIAGELIRAIHPAVARRHARRIKLIAIGWSAGVGYLILAWLFHHRYVGGEEKPRLLMAVLTPANLFTGVLGCGLFCLLVPWIDYRFLPKGLRMPWWLAVLNFISAAVFILLGFKGYWDNKDPLTESRWLAIAAIVTVFLIALVVAKLASLKTQAATGGRKKM